MLPSIRRPNSSPTTVPQTRKRGGPAPDQPRSTPGRPRPHRHERRSPTSATSNGNGRAGCGPLPPAPHPPRAPGHPASKPRQPASRATRLDNRVRAREPCTPTTAPTTAPTAGTSMPTTAPDSWLVRANTAPGRGPVHANDRSGRSRFVPALRPTAGPSADDLTRPPARSRRRNHLTAGSFEPMRHPAGRWTVANRSTPTPLISSRSLRLPSSRWVQSTKPPSPISSPCRNTLKHKPW